MQYRGKTAKHWQDRGRYKHKDIYRDINREIGAVITRYTSREKSRDIRRGIIEAITRDEGTGIGRNTRRGEE